MPNHWLDCLVMNAAAASLCGVILPGANDAGRPVRKARIKLSELQSRRPAR